MNPANGRLLMAHLGTAADLVQVLPAVSDVLRQRPGLAVDMLVDERLAEVPRLHPAVKRVIGLQRAPWHRALRDAGLRESLARTRAALQAERYDLVFDLQGRLELVGWGLQTGAPLVGHGRARLAQAAAALAYRRSSAVPGALSDFDAHRCLVAAQLGLPAPDRAADFGLMAPPLAWRAPVLSAALLPGPAGEDPWSDDQWQALAQGLARARLKPMVLHVDEADRSRADRIAQACQALRPPAEVSGWGLLAAALLQVRQVVAGGLDAAVLAAALRKHVIGVRAPRPDAARAGGAGFPGLQWLVGGAGGAPTVDEVLARLKV